MTKRKLSDLVDAAQPDAVLDEILAIVHLVAPKLKDTAVLRLAFLETVRLYKGDFPGYRACNTEYHDLRHTTDTTLTMTRLIHGANLAGHLFDQRQIVLGLMAALFHDAGYIQKADDLDGTGAKYTATHVTRSMDFFASIAPDLNLNDTEIAKGRSMILFTDLSVTPEEVTFKTPNGEFMGRMLGAADLLAQLADRTYLEKLLFLYREFKEAGVGGYSGERHLLEQTVEFYDSVSRRLDSTFDKAYPFMQNHLAARWNIQTNLYRQAIENQKIYLQRILEDPDTNHRNHFKRDGIVNVVRLKYGNSH
jgi:hypothetical protein